MTAHMDTSRSYMYIIYSFFCLFGIMWTPIVQMTVCHSVERHHKYGVLICYFDKQWQR